MANQLGRRFQEMLAVVERDQELFVLQVIEQQVQGLCSGLITQIQR